MLVQSLPLLSLIVSMTLVLPQGTVFASQGHGELEPGWSYHNTAWDGVCASGIRQSPVDIDDYDSVPGEEIKYAHYDDFPSTMELRNNGHSAKLGVKQEPMPYMRGGGLPGIFRFSQLHFHWGNNSEVGSEHHFHGKPYPLEVHWVHYNTKYSNINAAVNKVDGLAALSVLYRISSNPNGNLNPIIDTLTHVTVAENKTNLEKMFRLDKLLPKDRSRFFRYEGSLTTPTCNEVITWTILKEVQTISESQLEHFRKLRDLEGFDIGSNYRPVQPINGRKIKLVSSGVNRIENQNGILITLLLTIANVVLESTIL